MPQWTRNPDALRERYPDERWAGTCSREAAAFLVRYDHHVVRVRGREALLLTYHWSFESLDAKPEPFRFEVSFTYPSGHPSAPREVQLLVDQLTLVPMEDHWK